MNRDTPAERDEEVSALIETLDQTERRLEVLLAGQVDTVSDRAGRTFVLRHAQEHLRDAEVARQAAILNALPAHLALLDADGVIVSVNQAWQTFAAANAIQGSGSGIGANYLEICDIAQGEDASEARRAAAGIRAVLAGAVKSFSLEYACHSPAQQRWYLLTVTPLSADRPLGAVAMHLDITERNRTEAALRAGAVEFRALAEAMPQMVWITRADGWNIYFSQQWMDYTGLTQEESLGHGWVKPFHPDDQPRAQLAWQHATDTITIYSIECRLRRADGVYHWWLMRGVPQLDAAGKVLKWFGTCTDIHDLKSAELELSDSNRALRESDEKFQQLASHVADVFYVASSDLQKVHYVSPAYEKVWGRSVESLYANPQQWGEAIVSDEREQAIATFSRLANGEASVSLEFRIARSDGTVRCIFSRAFAIRDRDGKVGRITGIASDITERKAAEEVVKKRGAELERFHRLSVGRELQMIELKKQVNQLAGEAGQKPPYELAFLGREGGS